MRSIDSYSFQSVVVTDQNSGRLVVRQFDSPLEFRQTILHETELTELLQTFKERLDQFVGRDGAVAMLREVAEAATTKHVAWKLSQSPAKT